MVNINTTEDDNTDAIIDNFYSRHIGISKTKVVRLSLTNLAELKAKGITTERFLDHLCHKHSLLLHGSITAISDENLRSQRNMIFAANRSAIAIMRSLYSNRGVNLSYPYIINKERPLVLQVHTPPDGKFVKADNGFIYVVSNYGFRNDPEGSWQYINDVNQVKLIAVVETEDGDFKYPVEFINDFIPEQK